MYVGDRGGPGPGPGPARVMISSSRMRRGRPCDGDVRPITLAGPSIPQWRAYDNARSLVLSLPCWHRVNQHLSQLRRAEAEEQ